MCGIAGFSGEDKGKIERMTSCLAHRGPDGSGIEIGYGYSLGHRRLAILDPRPEGNQPMWNENRTIAIVYNGEIFNFRELRTKHNLTCKTETDTEVLIRLYEKFGMSFVPELLGMFAFAILDTEKKTLHLARDHAGIKPLFLAMIENELHFASEMRALLAAFPEKPKLNVASLSRYLRLQYVPGPETLCEGITSLPPGTILSFQNERELRTSFTPKTDMSPFGTSQKARIGLPSLLGNIVSDHLVSDKPLGLFLSGGMDSSIILYHMTQAMKEPVKTFTVRFDATEAEDAARFNKDADLAAMTAKHYETDHHEIHLTAELCRTLYKDAACALDQPNADAVATAMYLLSKEAKQHVDVVVTGAGGDELFGGYPRYRVARILGAMKRLPRGIRSLGAIAGYPNDVLRMEPGAALAERLLARPAKEGKMVARDWFDPETTTRLFAQRYETLQGRDAVRNFMQFDKNLWLVDESLRLTDALTMGSGLEARVPFLDPRLSDGLKNISGSSHVTLMKTKALLKDAYRTILPSHLYTLPKASFYPPLAKWLRRECAPLIDEALSNPHMEELFDVAKIRALAKEHADGKYHLHSLSSVIQLANWFETVYDV